jgi:hypothetical protein
MDHWTSPTAAIWARSAAVMFKLRMGSRDWRASVRRPFRCRPNRQSVEELVANFIKSALADSVELLAIFLGVTFFILIGLLLGRRTANV